MRSFDGPLRICADNPRYFTNNTGKAIYLTGSHVWHSLKEVYEPGALEPFNYDAYLDLLKNHHHNFMRMWVWDFPQHMLEDKLFQSEPHQWVRSGPENALDGKPKFDLTQLNEAYFQRLRQRVEAAASHGIYVSIMFFEGWAIHSSQEPWCRNGHPMCKDNNINNIDGDPDNTGRMFDTHGLKYPAITAIQETYIKKVIDTVNDLDNVLYEISNETGAYSTQWQYHLINFIHTYEKQKPKQHPVGMTFQQAQNDKGTNQALFDSPADWISPNPEGGYKDNPPPADGSKIILTDTDHLWGLGCASGWVWKSFTRGLNPILMDPIKPFPGIDDHPSWGNINHPDHPLWEPIRKQMGDTLDMAKRINLTAMTPHNELSSSTYCLANPGHEYLIYIPEGGTVTADLSHASGTFYLEWFSVINGNTIEKSLALGGQKHEFTAPFDGEAVLYIYKQQQS
jgi:hypothetical protein